MTEHEPGPSGAEPHPFSSAERIQNRPQDPRAMGMALGVLVALGFGGLIVLIATIAGNAPFDRIGHAWGEMFAPGACNTTCTIAQERWLALTSAE